MAKEFNSVAKKFVAKGIDKFSAKASLEEGFAEDIVNMDTNLSGSLETRKGYEGYYGYVPWRVSAASTKATGYKVQFRFDGADFSGVQKGPLLVTGKTSTGSFLEFPTTTTTRLYPEFTVPDKVSLGTGSSSFQVLGDAHEITDNLLTAGLALSSSSSSRNNSLFLPDLVTFSSTTKDVTVNYTNNASPQDAYVYLRGLGSSLGVVYQHAITTAALSFSYINGTFTLVSHGFEDGDVVQVTSYSSFTYADTLYYVVNATTNTLQLSASLGGSAVAPAGVTSLSIYRRSWSIPSATHNLQNFNIVPYLFQDLTGSYATASYSSFSISTAGLCVLTLAADGTPGTFAGYIVLESVDSAESTTFAPSAGSQTFSFSSEDVFAFPALYEYNASFSRYEQILVDDWSYDEATEEVTVTYTASTSGDVKVYWTGGQPISNIIEVDAETLVTDISFSEDVQLTVWGLSHRGNYVDEGGSVNALDSYRTATDTRLVSGLGGVLYKTAPFSELTQVSTVYNRNASRLEAAVKLAPLFWSSDPGSVRTRGVVWDSTVVDNYAVVTAATYISSGVVDYTLSFSNKSATFASQVTSNDFLTVSGLANSVHTGSWRIVSVTDGGTTAATFRVQNSGVFSNRFDETGAAGKAGVFTDRIQTESLALFVEGDQLVCPANEHLENTVVSASFSGGWFYWVDGVTEALDLSDGLQLTALKTSSLVPVGDVAGAADDGGILVGDMLTVSDLSRKVRALSVQTQSDQTATYSSGVYTVPSNHRLNAGDKVLLSNGDTLFGEYTVALTPDALSFTLEDDPAPAGGTTATLFGKMLFLDEEIETQGGFSSTSFYPEGRWSPVESPEQTQTLLENLYPRYFTDSEESLKSVSLGNKLFFTNGSDEVMTFDGTYVTRVGLPLWQPFLFVSQPGTGGKLNDDILSVASCDFTPGTVSITGANAHKLNGFHVGDPISLTSGSDIAYATVHRIESTSDNKTTITLINMSRSDSPFNGSTTVTIASTPYYRYYFRLDVLDRQGNTISSGMTGYNDCVVRYVGTGKVQLKLVGLPSLSNYDYDRITLELYRTTADLAQPYFVGSKTIPFGTDDKYIVFEDSTSDYILRQKNDIDPLRILKGSELGNGWRQPPKAKHISSVDGRLLLANLTDYPQVTLNFEGSSSSSAISNLGLAQDAFIFRKDNTSTGLVCDLDNVAAYEFVSGTAGIGCTATVGTTYITITKAGHSRSVGDWIYLYYGAVGANNITASGWYKVSTVVDANNFRLNNNSSVTTGALSMSYVVAASGSSSYVPVLLETDGNYNNTAVQNMSDAKSNLAVYLANAINASMRFTANPWLVAYAGADYPAGQVTVSTTKNISTTPEVRTPLTISGYTLYIDDNPVAQATEVDFTSKRFPSRLLRSYKNYPEIFDNPTVNPGEPSDSVIDVNPDDGQEITALAPFFGTSSGSDAGQLTQKVVVFKTNSIYLVNVETREIQKIASRGLGCTAPASVAAGKDCLFFANESGICRLNRDLTVTLENKLNNYWKGTVNRSALAAAAGHHHSVARRYKLSLPTGDDTTNSQVAVYDYDPEDRGEPGGWVRYTNFNATGWCNLASQSFWASDDGNVFLARDRGEASDYRDDGDAVAEASVTLKAEDFGLPGIRKVIQNFVTFLDTTSSSTEDLKVYSATDLNSSFTLQDTVSKLQGEVMYFRSAVSTRRGNYFQVKYTHQKKDQKFTLSGITYTVGQLSYKLTREGADG